jgi:Na+/H+ antiporter NhaA
MLAFVDAERAAEIRIGVLLGSIMSAIVGYLVLRRVTPAVVSAKPATRGH